MTAFQCVREDGRSNGQVLLDLVKDKEPGTVFTYQVLIEALSVGLAKPYTRPEVQRIVVATGPRMLKEQARALHNIRTVGYRIAPAMFHMTLANDRKCKADKQFLYGVQLLENVKWEEMDANQRAAHQGQLLVMSALYQNQKALERRQMAVEQAIREVQASPTP
jgi:hypothetical protein